MKRHIQIPIRLAFIGVMGLLLGLLILSSCSELEEKYIRKDKLFRIAFLEDRRAYDKTFLDKNLLNDPDPEIRAKTALAMGRIGYGYYNTYLGVHLADSNEVAAGAKFFAVGLTKDSTLFDAVYKLAITGTPALDRAVEALGKIADSTQSPKIAEFLTHSDSLVVYQTMLALFRAGEWSEAKKMADIGKASARRIIKFGALYSLSRGRRAEGKELFLSLIADADPEFRMQAYGGLGRISDTASVKLIATGLNDSDKRVIASAMYALRAFGELGAVYIGLKLPDLKDEKLVVLALEIIGDFPRVARAEQMTVKALREDIRENVKAAAANTLLKIKGKEALFVIDDLLPNPTNHQKTTIASGLAKIDKDVALSRLGQYLNAEAPFVRVYALDGLCTVDSNGAAKYIDAGLNDSDFVVQSTAIDFALRYKRFEFISRIAEMYLNAPRTIDDDIKRSIIDGFANLEKNPEFDNLIIAVLEEGCNDDWFFLRRRAATVLRDKYDIDKFATIGAAQTTIDKYNYDELFGRYPSNPRALITTARGEIVFELFYNIAPKTVNNYIKLVESGYYDSLSFHRVIPNFVVQDGCPLGTGWGGPGYAIKCENNSLTYKTGMVGMALSGKDTGGSQYFITLSPQPHLDGNYTIFGEVESGMEVAQELVRGDIIESVRIVHAEE